MSGIQKPTSNALAAKKAKKQTPLSKPNSNEIRPWVKLLAFIIALLSLAPFCLLLRSQNSPMENNVQGDTNPQESTPRRQRRLFADATGLPAFEGCVSPETQAEYENEDGISNLAELFQQHRGTGITALQYDPDSTEIGEICPTGALPITINGRQFFVSGVQMERWNPIINPYNIRLLMRDPASGEILGTRRPSITGTEEVTLPDGTSLSFIPRGIEEGEDEMALQDEEGNFVGEPARIFDPAGCPAVTTSDCLPTLFSGLDPNGFEREESQTELRDNRGSIIAIENRSVSLEAFDDPEICTNPDFDPPPSATIFEINESDLDDFANRVEAQNPRVE